MLDVSTPDLIDAQDWRKNATARAHQLFKSNQGVANIAALMAAAHPYAIQYIEQAPAVVPFCTFGRPVTTRQDRAYIAARFGSAVHMGPRLKELLSGFGAPLQIRKLSAYSVNSTSFPALIQLRKIEPSDLAQAIPDKPGQQAKWLRALREVVRFEKTFSHRDHSGLWRWAVMTFGRETPSHEEVRDLLDMLQREPEIFNPKWTMAGAIEAQERWHRDLAKQTSEEKFLRSHGFGFEDQFDYAPLPDHGEAGGFEFVALRSGLDLFTEGAAMRHCVSTYVRKVMSGQSRIYSVRKDGRRVATLELSEVGRSWAPVQIKGPYNAQPPKEVQRAAITFVFFENARIKEEREAEKKTMGYWTGVRDGQET